MGGRGAVPLPRRQPRPPHRRFRRSPLEEDSPGTPLPRWPRPCSDLAPPRGEGGSHPVGARGERAGEASKHTAHT